MTNTMCRIVICGFLVLMACNKSLVPIEEGNDPNFKITANEEGVLKRFSRQVEVFGIKIFAVPGVADDRLLHAANVLAQYLDNDEDGIPDNPAVLESLLEQKAFLVMWEKERDLNINPPNGWEGQDLGHEETQPNYVGNGLTSRFDASLEEVLHLITHVGYAKTYPDVFGEKPGTEIAKAMDTARGGQFMAIPTSYPTDAWYTYDDETCDYSCMVTEYHYWALTSLLGAQENRLEEIEHEWKLNSKEKLRQGDSAIFQLLTDPQYKFPSVLPDGSYQR
ncbi:MAG: hypothetical protein KTR30_37255 [Saprospiraceae bacterium]|nr:hypothetical protein [Saprospiraceae bacterium]